MFFYIVDQLLGSQADKRVLKKPEIIPAHSPRISVRKECFQMKQEISDFFSTVPDYPGPESLTSRTSPSRKFRHGQPHRGPQAPVYQRSARGGTYPPRSRTSPAPPPTLPSLQMQKCRQT